MFEIVIISFERMLFDSQNRGYQVDRIRFRFIQKANLNFKTHRQTNS